MQSRRTNNDVEGWYHCSNHHVGDCACRKLFFFLSELYKMDCLFEISSLDIARAARMKYKIVKIAFLAEWSPSHMQ